MFVLSLSPEDKGLSQIVTTNLNSRALSVPPISLWVILLCPSLAAACSGTARRKSAFHRDPELGSNSQRSWNFSNPHKTNPCPHMTQGSHRTWWHWKAEVERPVLLWVLHISLGLGFVWGSGRATQGSSHSWASDLLLFWAPHHPRAPGWAPAVPKAAPRCSEPLGGQPCCKGHLRAVLWGVKSPIFTPPLCFLHFHPSVRKEEAKIS